MVCLGTQEEFNDDGYMLENPRCSPPALLRTVYREKKLHVKEQNPGIFRFSDWLPAGRLLNSDGFPVTYRSRKLASVLGLHQLFITFSGYWPAIGAAMTTGTFKECEAYSVCSRLPEDSGRILVVSSAGNTARAFAKVASDNDIPVVVVVPENCMGSLWSPEPLRPCVKLVAVADADYTDAIRIGALLSRYDGFINEGGAKNVARRDGMGTTVLSAAAEIGGIPDFYFQAVGSGTGAIAAYEAYLRLLESGCYGSGKMRLMLSQNIPFTPMVSAWEKRSRAIAPADVEDAADKIDRILAKVLSNRQPPYGITGGLYDALADTDGDIVAIGNSQLSEAQSLFLETEGRDICPEAGVALASLIRKVDDGTVGRDACVMLNVTGGGMEALKRERPLISAEPSLVIEKDIGGDELQNEVLKLFDRVGARQ